MSRNRVSVFADGVKIRGPWRPRNGVRMYADGVQIEPAMIVISGSGLKTIILQGTNGEKVRITWGDGTTTIHTLLGAGTDVTCQNTYAAVGDHFVYIEGNI